jgi:3'-phosphoadenosine 5'-phosphosulfate sulfotransferase
MRRWTAESVGGQETDRSFAVVKRKSHSGEIHQVSLIGVKRFESQFVGFQAAWTGAWTRCLRGRIRNFEIYCGIEMILCSRTNNVSIVDWSRNGD